tara:strand:- start:548 stop:1156 length:609 start_codon:yes stop_codon:yes gene_type:complete
MAFKTGIKKDYEVLYRAMRHIGNVIQHKDLFNHKTGPTELNQNIIGKAENALKNRNKWSLKYSSKKQSFVEYQMISQSFVDYLNFFNNGLPVQNSVQQKTPSLIEYPSKNETSKSSSSDIYPNEKDIKSELKKMNFTEKYIVAHYLKQGDEDLNLELFEKGQEQKLADYCTKYNINGEGKGGYIFENEKNKLESILLDITEE